MNIFGGMKTLWIFFFGGGGSSQNWSIFRVISMHSRVSSLGQGTEWGTIFWIAKIFQYFFGVLEIPDIFWGEWARVYV